MEQLAATWADQAERDSPWERFEVVEDTATPWRWTVKPIRSA